MKNWEFIIGLIIVLGLNSCSFYADINEDEIKISKEDLTDLKLIQKDISKNFEFIAEGNGYFSDRFYFNTDRFERKLQIIESNNFKKLIDLNKQGTIKSMRIIQKDCTAYLLKFSDPNYLFHEYWDEVWLIYHGEENHKCGLMDNSHEKTVWKKELEHNWMLIKNKRKRYIGG